MVDCIVILNENEKNATGDTIYTQKIVMGAPYLKERFSLTAEGKSAAELLFELIRLIDTHFSKKKGTTNTRTIYAKTVGDNFYAQWRPYSSLKVTIGVSVDIIDGLTVDDIENQEFYIENDYEYTEETKTLMSLLKNSTDKLANNSHTDNDVKLITDCVRLLNDGILPNRVATVGYLTKEVKDDESDDVTYMGLII